MCPQLNYAGEFKVVKEKISLAMYKLKYADVLLHVTYSHFAGLLKSVFSGVARLG